MRAASAGVGVGVGAQQPQGPAPLSLEDALSRCRAAVGEGLAAVRGAEVVVHGTGSHLGSPVAWSLRFRRDGAFYEEVRSKYLTFKWGYNGGADSTVWEVDPSGVAKHLEYDDHESMLLALLVRSGCWLDAEAMAGRLEYRALHVGAGAASSPLTREGVYGSTDDVSDGDGGSWQEAALRAMSGRDASTSYGGSQSGDAGSGWGVFAAGSGGGGPQAGAGPKGPPRRVGPKRVQRRITVNPRGPGTAAAPAPLEGGGGGPVFIDIALTGTKMLARVELCPRTWRPVGFGQALVSWESSGDSTPPTVWSFEDWRRWQAPATQPPAGLTPGAGPWLVPSSSDSPGQQQQQQQQQQQLEQQQQDPGRPAIHYPMRVRHNANVGGAHDYHTVRLQLQTARISSVTYTIPLCTKLPVDASFEAGLPAGTWAWKAPSGHIVVQVQISGMDAPGYMLLDTGASGFVLQAGLAARYGLTQFGRLNIAGLTGKIFTCFCRASTIRLGPLVVRDPVFMEMNVGGLVRGLDEGIIGIAGYDVFRRAVFEFPTPEETAAALQPFVHAGAATNGAGGGAAVAPEQRADAGAPTPSGGASDDEGMRAFDAGALTPLQRQLSGTAHAASVAAAHAGRVGGPALPFAHVRPNAAAGGAPGAGPPPVPVPGMHPAPPGRGLAPLWLMIHNPEEPTAFSDHYVWHPMRLIGNLPHAEITFRTEAGSEHRALFMIDSGAGGADLLFHGRATREMGLVTEDEAAGRGDRSRVRTVRGVGGEGQNAMKVVLGDLQWADWGGVRFHKIRALFSLKGGLDISLYSAGIIGADLINRRRVVVDYPNKRVGILAHPGSHA